MGKRTGIGAITAGAVIIAGAGCAGGQPEKLPPSPKTASRLLDERTPDSGKAFLEQFNASPSNPKPRNAAILRSDAYITPSRVSDDLPRAPLSYQIPKVKALVHLTSAQVNYHNGSTYITGDVKQVRAVNGTTPEQLTSVTSSTQALFLQEGSPVPYDAEPDGAIFYYPVTVTRVNNGDELVVAMTGQSTTTSSTKPQIFTVDEMTTTFTTIGTDWYSDTYLGNPFSALRKLSPTDFVDKAANCFSQAVGAESDILSKGKLKALNACLEI